MLRETDWKNNRRKQTINESSSIHFDSKFNVKYKLPKEKLISLSIDDMYKWYDEYERRKKNEVGRYGGIFLEPYEQETHPLNILYEMKCGVEKE